METVFVNLSNHSSEKWSEKQIAEAKKFGDIIDLKFPKISPTSTSDEVEDKAWSYFCEIHDNKKIYKNPVIHIMGEMGFTYKFIRHCEDHNISCIHSCTERKVVEKENGEKISVFEFVQFREY